MALAAASAARSGARPAVVGAAGTSRRLGVVGPGTVAVVVDVDGVTAWLSVTDRKSVV